MNALERRLWITGVALIASLVILAGLAVGAFRIGVQLVPEYRAEVEQRVADLIGSPVRIERMDLIWRGRYPTLQLRDLEVGPHASRRLALQELSLGFAITRLLRGDAYPAQVSLRGTQLQLIRENGEFRLAGVNKKQAVSGEGQSLPQFLDQLRRIARIRWYDSALRLDDRDTDQAPIDIVITELSTDRRLGGLDLSLQAHLAGQPGRQLELELELDAEPWRPLRAHLHAEKLLPGPFIAAYWPQAPVIDGELLKLDVKTRWDGRAWQSAEVEFDLRDLTPLQQNVAVKQLAGRAVLDPQGGDNGIRASIDVQQLQTANKSWPKQSILLQWQGGLEAPRYALNLEYLDLAELQPWSALLPEKLAQATRQMQPQGEIRALVVQSLPGQAVPRVSAELKQVAFQAYEKIPGLAHLDAELSFSGAEARLQIDSEGLEIEAPDIFDKRLILDEFSGGMRWSQTSDGWQLDAPGLHYAGMNLDGVGRVQLQQAEQLRMELDLNFFCSDPRPWLDYQPVFWGDKLRGWMRSAVNSVQVAAGEVRIQGDLSQFPFPDRQGGEFVVDLDLRDVDLQFAPDWPAVETSTARLTIDGRTLSVDTSGAQIGQIETRQARATIADLRRSELDIDAQLSGDAKEAWRILGGSGLRKRLSGLFDSLDMSGAISGRLNLFLPLKSLQETRYAADLDLDRAALWTSFWPDPVQKITGKLRIDQEGLRGRDVQAAIAGLPITADLTPKQGETQIEARFAAGLQQLPDSVPVPDFIQSRARGTADWRLSLRVGGPNKPVISAHSSLLGLALDLPEPFGKTAEQVRILDVRIDPAQSTRLHLNYGESLGLDMLLAAKEPPRAARLRLGGDALPAGAPGWWVEGQLARAEFSQWLPVIQDLVAEFGSGSSASSRAFGGLVIQVQQLHALGQKLPDTRLQLTQQQAVWQLGVAGPRANGVLRFLPTEAGQRPQIQAEFEQMNWTRAIKLEAEEGYLDPRAVPGLELVAKDFSLNDIALGELRLKLEPLADGLRMADVSVDAGERRELGLTGLWLRNEQGSSAALELEMDSRSFDSWLSILGYQDNIRADQAVINAKLDWSPSPDGLLLSNLSGDLGFAFDDGQLLNIEPGAGRVLGLFSVNALPRRFFLDFSDVVSSGLGFDELKGDFSLANGLAQTQNLEMKAPSLRMAARGSVDLVERTYDQQITIYPGVSSGVSLAATLLGGPVVGLFAVLAQELLEQPLDQVTQFGYHLGGSWDNPQVSRLQ